MAIALTSALILLVICRVFRPDDVHYPCEKVIVSVLPSFYLFLVAQPMLKFFYGATTIPSDYSLRPEPIKTLLNDAIGNYLTVSGVLYSLIISHLFSLTNERFSAIRDALGGELSVCRQIVLCVKAISITAGDQNQVALKLKALRVVVWYVQHIARALGAGAADNLSLDIMYGILPVISKLCESTNVQFNYQVADRIVNALNELSTVKYRRESLEDRHLSNTLWVLQYLLSTAMFFGVLLINSGSVELNLTLCAVATVLIGMSALVIADMDMPYMGCIAIDKSTVHDLIAYLHQSQNETEISTNLDKRNSIFFKSDNRQLSATMSNIRKLPRRSWFERLTGKIIPAGDAVQYDWMGADGESKVKEEAPSLGPNTDGSDVNTINHKANGVEKGGTTVADVVTYEQIL
mmetsp:Transcript_4900/g.7469  ORF Transcript_4900/g.7469 Transcript_4900/m.7469 type:complete len:406 (-) Transcript_4900:265-1482(-)